jgi:hypothetical protein
LTRVTKTPAIGVAMALAAKSAGYPPSDARITAVASEATT